MNIEIFGTVSCLVFLLSVFVWPPTCDNFGGAQIRTPSRRKFFTVRPPSSKSVGKFWFCKLASTCESVWPALNIRTRTQCVLSQTLMISTVSTLLFCACSNFSFLFAKSLSVSEDTLRNCFSNSSSLGQALIRWFFDPHLWHIRSFRLSYGQFLTRCPPSLQLKHRLVYFRAPFLTRLLRDAPVTFPPSVDVTKLAIFPFSLSTILNCTFSPSPKLR